MWRNLFTLGSYRFRPLPNISFVDQFVENAEYPGEKRLVRIYNGKTSEREHGRDVVIFYFAGAWMLGSVSDNDRLLRTIAAQTDFVVVGIEYSLAPEYIFPRGFDDALFGLRWVRDNIAQYGGNPRHIFVSGESAGGNLAAAVVARNLDRENVDESAAVNIAGLVLVYPPLSADFEVESYVKYARYNGILTTAEMQHAWSMYRGGRDISPGDYTYQPLVTPEAVLSHFPRTEILAAEFDVLRDDSVRFADKLRGLGVPAQLTLYNGTIHGFFGREFSPAGFASVQYVCNKLLEWSAELCGGQQCNA